MTRVLVTNDDGIAAAGLHALARAAVAAGHDVTIAAPAQQSSGASASIMAEHRDGRITIEPHTIEGLEDIPAFAVHAGPGLIALVAARGAFGDPAEAVLSGVNHGANVGRAILHSGTVGAALTAGLNGAHGMAVSLDTGFGDGPHKWDAAATAALELLPALLTYTPGTVLNVNVPDAEARGLCEATLAPFGMVQTTLSERVESHMRLAVEDMAADPEPGTDAAHLRDGWITVTALDAVSAVALGLVEDGRLRADARRV